MGIIDQAMILEMRQVGKKNQRILKTIGRYSDSPPELILELQDDEWICLGTGAEAVQREYIERICGALTNDPQTVDTLIEKTDLTGKQVRRSLKILTDQNRITRSGEGVKNDPHAFQLA